MQISLINIDSKIPNLALAKIAKYHEGLGDTVIYDCPLEKADKTYVSCVFTKNKHKAEQYIGRAEIGGSGYSLDITLPPEIEEIKPRINYGFTTRGCIRNCDFCIVPKKEGKIRIVGDLLDLWDGKSKLITVMDNNIIALPEHFTIVCQQAIDNKIKVDFNQGLDHRLLTDELCKTLARTPHLEYRFAFDHPSYKKTVDRAIDILLSNGIKRSTWYVLVGFNTTFEDDLWRCNYLKERNQNVFVQRYETVQYDVKYSLLARWGNQHHIFQSYTWDKFISHEKHRVSAKKCGLNVTELEPAQGLFL
jgi:hypothetical protein